MSQLLIDIPDDLAHSLEHIAAVEKKSVEQVALERLKSSITGAGSASAILRAMNELPHITRTDIDELESSIRAGRLPVGDTAFFDEPK